MNRKDEKLSFWQKRYCDAKSKYMPYLEKMDFYDSILNGSKDIYSPGGTKAKQGASFVRNIVYELIEAQVDNTIPYPKVTALREQQCENARKLENKLRNEIDRLPFEEINDKQERLTPSLGGSVIWVEWDNFKRTHSTVGELDVKLLHPKQFIPQPGVYEVEEMEYFFLIIPRTKEYIKTRYKIAVEDETESEPQIKGDEETADGMVTQIIVYYRKDGHICRYSYVNDICLEDIENYQARKLRRCRNCFTVCDDGICPVCGGRSFDTTVQDCETVSEDLVTGDKRDSLTGEITYDTEIPAGAEIEYYVPDIYPIVLRKNISSYNSLLGISDIEVIKDMQNSIKKIDTNIEEKLLKGGSVFIKPKGVKMKMDDGNLKVCEIDEPSQKTLFDIMNIQVDVNADYSYADRLYQIARNELGITDSFQGRKDPTANSGTAKQISVQQTAGRLESKKIMKNSCFGKLYEIMAKFYIAFADEPRPVRYNDEHGNPTYEEFSKWDFIEQDSTGKYFYNVDYLFSTDPSGSLAANREAMWQETRQNFTSGAFGDPSSYETIYMFWSVMESLHYPSSNRIKKQVEDMIEKQNRERAALQASVTQVPQGEAAAESPGLIPG